MQNSLMIIVPYLYEEIWVFNDEKLGLEREPFVSGVPEMINTLTKDISNAEKGFRLIFSGNPFPGYQAELDWIRSEYGGNWYRWEKNKQEGWLCPALFKYFSDTPSKIYCRAEQLTRNKSNAMHDFSLNNL